MIDLHLHLDGSLNPDNVPLMAEMSGIELDLPIEELKKMLMVEPDCTNLGEYLKKFELPLKLLQTRECIEYAVYELMRDLNNQGLCYVEIRFAPQLHKRNNLSQDEVVQAAIEGLNKGKRDFSLSANLILCCMRGADNFDDNIETIDIAKRYLGKGVCAVDLAGNEAAYPTSNFEEIFKRAHNYGIPIIIHAGEADGPLSIRSALDFGAIRIGHGINARKDTELMNRLKKDGIFLEMCYSSNLQTKTVDNPDDYPIRQFLENKLLVTLNTDNITVSNTSLKNEYRLVMNNYSLDKDTMLQIAQNGVLAAFISEEEKNSLKCRINKEFFEWLQY